MSSSKLGRPLWGGEGAAIKNFRGIVGSVGAPKPYGIAEGAWIPLSKHRGMMWSFDLGTEGARADPRSHEVHERVCVCLCVRIDIGGGKREQGSLGSLQMATDGRHSPAWLLDTGKC